jgi:hypothetical protein
MTTYRPANYRKSLETQRLQPIAVGEDPSGVCDERPAARGALDTAPGSQGEVCPRECLTTQTTLYMG